MTIQKMNNKFDAFYWSDKYKNNSTGWDLGNTSTPLKNYFDQLIDKSISILIPGGGNGYEAEYLNNLGFNHVYILDIAKQPLKNFRTRVPHFPIENLINEDFFAHKGEYDLIIEQTFFCALDPSLREMYSNKMHELLKEKGNLVGLLFNFPLTEKGPPFGGSKKEYSNLFSKQFKIKILEKSYNSIAERNGKELFIKFEKK